MYKFNNDTIITGYIKQLLASFNLPKCRIYIEDEPIIQTRVWKGNESDDFVTMYVPYIRNNELQEYIIENNVGNWYPKGWRSKDLPAHIHYYEYNKYIPNYTKNLEIRNNIYDSYTHEYLGDYLRFHRDYAKINLMPLYNCFSNRICSNLNLNFNVGNQTVIFDGRSISYKIYMLPIKLFKEYTIAIDSSLPIEICCGIYGKYQGTNDTLAKIPELTYKKYNMTKFSKPFLYEELKTLKDKLAGDTNTFDAIAQNELNLKMFLKVPVETTSSITILEGNYLNWNDQYNFTVGEDNVYKFTKNYAMYDIYKATSEDNFKYITNLQLLKLNTNESYPFADRLIEYLVGNAITNIEENADNISRVQKVLDTGDIVKTRYNGAWNNLLGLASYLYMNTTNTQAVIEANHDNLGYVDKDVEQLLKVKTPSKELTIKNVDLYPEIYKSDKESN